MWEGQSVIDKSWLSLDEIADGRWCFLDAWECASSFACCVFHLTERNGGLVGSDLVQCEVESDAEHAGFLG
jgi:hypothetical protein